MNKIPPKSAARAKAASAALGFAALSLATGCTSYVTSSQAAAFNQAAASVGTNLQASIQEVQSVETQEAVSAFARGTNQTLEKLNTAPKLSDATANAIASQFAVLVSYSTSLKAAATPGAALGGSITGLAAAQSKAVTDAGALAAAIGQSALLSSAQVQKINTDSGNIAKGFSTAAQGLVTIYGEEKAYEIAHDTDSAVQEYCTDLEKILDNRAASPATGLRAILQADYEEQAGYCKNFFTTAPPPGSYDSPTYLQNYLARVAVIGQYTTLVDNERADLAKFDALVKAIAGMASAHAALANRRPGDFIAEVKTAAGLLQSAFGPGSSGAANSAATANATATP